MNGRESANEVVHLLRKFIFNLKPLLYRDLHKNASDSFRRLKICVCVLKKKEVRCFCVNVCVWVCKRERREGWKFVCEKKCVCVCVEWVFQRGVRPAYSWFAKKPLSNNNRGEMKRPKVLTRVLLYENGNEEKKWER